MELFYFSNEVGCGMKLCGRDANELYVVMRAFSIYICNCC